MRRSQLPLASSKSLPHQSCPSSPSISSPAGPRQSLSSPPCLSKFAWLLNISILGRDRRDEGSEAHASVGLRTTSVPSSLLYSRFRQRTRLMWYSKPSNMICKRNRKKSSLCKTSRRFSATWEHRGKQEQPIQWKKATLYKTSVKEIKS